MNQVVSNIKNIPGVVGVAVFKDNGSLVMFDFPEAYDKNLLELLGLKFQPIKEILPQDEGEIAYLCWEYENLLSFYYPVTGGWVNIISSDQVPMPVFSLTMTAVSKKLPSILEEAQPLQGEPQATAGAPLPENAVPPEKIAELEKLAALYLGPAAPVIFKRVALQAGYTLNNIPPTHLKTFLEDVAAKIPENKREEAMEKITAYLGHPDHN
jgi:hypothetical protein